MPAAIYIAALDEMGSTIYQGPRISEITGYPASEYVANPRLWLDSMHRQDRRAVLRSLTATHEAGREFHTEYRILAAGGRVVWVSDDAVIVRDADGRPVCLHGLVRDITAQRAADEARAAAAGAYRNELEQRVSERTVELELANLKLKSELAVRRQAEAAEREHRLFAEALGETVAALTRTLDFGELLDRIHSSTRSVVPHEAATIMLCEAGVATVARSYGHQHSPEGKRLVVAEQVGLRQMAATGRPLIVADTRDGAGWTVDPGEPWARSYLGAPIFSQGQIAGFIALLGAEPGSFTEAQAEWLLAFAGQAGIAIQNARLFDELRRQAREMEIISNVALASVGGESFDEIVARATQDLRQLWPKAALGFLFVEAGQGTLRMHPSYFGVSPDVVASTHIPLGQGIIGWAALQRRPAWSADVAADPRYKAVLPGVGCELCAPMVVHDRCIGVLNVSSFEPDAFLAPDVRLLCTLADQLATVFERARLDAELAEERASLVQRVTERTADLQMANEELARASRAKDEFLATMSHELRTPLNAILGLSEAMLQEVYGPVAEQQARSLQILHESGGHLMELINDILDLSRTEAGKLELQVRPVDVEAACRASMQMITQSAAKRRIEIRAQYDERVKVIQADPRRFKQILVNLLSNAVKFTPEGGVIGLNVTGSTQQKMAEFAVWDSGIGIDETDAQRLFQPFVQLDSSLSRQYEGSGLGLALVRRLAELHGGRVALSSQPGQGSRFTVSLPWWPAAEAEEGALPVRGQETVPLSVTRSGADAHLIEGEDERCGGVVSPSLPLPALGADSPARNQGAGNSDWPAAASAPGAAAAPLLLLADDNATSIAAMADYLEYVGYRVALARNGQEACTLSQQLGPDLILMDVQMPGMDGLEAIRQIRSGGAMAAVPIIALTALAMPGDRERILASGASAYLSKPVSLRELAETTAALLRNRG
jgi:PAS domain S-box-containing protein